MGPLSVFDLQPPGGDSHPLLTMTVTTLEGAVLICLAGLLLIFGVFSMSVIASGACP